MVVDKASIMNIMGGMESTAGVRLHNHRRKLRQRFDIIKKLGQGTYGKVQLGINKETGQEVAIKTIKKSKIESEADLVRIRREIQIMSSVQHPNIIHIYEVFENREKMVLVMEYAAGGELYDFLSERKVLAEDEARRLFRQIATAVYYCHKHKICHRDLKLENILLDENGSAKIADFGLSNVFDETRLLGTFCGSPLYASPEIVQGNPYHGPEVDCWSLGVLLYTLVYGAMPFDGSNFKRLVKQISQGDYFEPKKPSAASPLIRDMLTVSPTKRADIVKICSHWWVNEGQSESCLDIAEHLANQTPVRLDLLLSLAPPVSADQVVVTTDQKGNGEAPGSAEGPIRSHSVGSLMDLDQPSAERRIRDFVNSTKAENSKSRGNLDKLAETSKRKLEDAVSTEDASAGGAKKKERSRSKQRSSRSDRRSSSRSKKPAESMDVESDALTRSDSKDLTLAAACAITDSLQDKPSESCQSEEVVSTEGKRKSTKSVKKKTKSEKDEASRSTPISTADIGLEPDVGEGKSGREPTQEAKVPVQDSSIVEESTKGKVKRKATDKDESKPDIPAPSTNDKSSDTSPSDESVRSSQSEPCVEEVKDEINGDDLSEGVVSIMSSSTAPVSSISLNDTGTDIAVLDKAKSQGKISLSKIISPTTDMPIPVPVPTTPEDPEPPKSTERRKSKIFETAEKFNNLANAERRGSSIEKPKKIHIPGVKVSDAKAAFERKSSITSSTASVPTAGERKSSLTSVPAAVKNSLSKKTIVDQTNTPESTIPSVSNASEIRNDEGNAQSPSEPSTPGSGIPNESERAKKVKEAVGVISSVIEGQVTGRKVSLKKTPRLNSFDGSTTGTPSVPGTPLSPTGVDPSTGMKTVRVQVAPNDIRLATIQVSTPQATKYPGEEPPPLNQNIQATVDVEENEPKKTASKMEITLKSATLPRRKTSEAKIQMGTPPPVKASSPEKLERMIQAPPSPGRRASVGQPLGGYRSEVEHIVGAADYPNRPRHQRSEVSFPVAAASSTSRVHPMPFRSASCEPESSKSKPREHIIPIHFEADENTLPQNTTAPAKPPVPPTTSQSASGNLPYQRTLSQLSQRSNSLSRQSTQDSDTESTISQSTGEPIRKSPREYIIPIAVEGGGYVTPRATSLEPSEDSRASTHSLPRSRLSSRTKRMSRERHRSKFSSLLSESEDEGPFAALHRHSSIGRDSDNEDRPSTIHLHRLRSSRPAQRTLEHTDSMSSAEEEDDDEGFELLTAENLFSSLLSRVRSLTQRLNVEDGGRPGFPSSRLLSQFGAHPGSRASPFMFPSSMLSRGSPFEPLSRRISETSRSFSRNDSESGSVGPTPWRRSVSRDVSDTDSLYSESHNSGTLPKGRSSADFSEGSSSLSSYSYTPSLAARLAQYQQGSASSPQTPRTLRSYTKSKSTGVGSADEPSRFPRYGSQSSYSSARRLASGVTRALEEELNGLNIPTSYLPTPTVRATPTSDDGDGFYSSATARRLGLSRTMSMRERSASPGGSSSVAPASSYLSRTPLLSSSRRPFSYSSSVSDSGAGLGLDRDRPPLPSATLPRRPLALGSSRRADLKAASDDDCMYYEILPSQRKEAPPAPPAPPVSSDSLTRSCPSATFLDEPRAAAAEAVEEPEVPAVSRLGRSVSVSREPRASDPALRRSASTRATPERSILSKFFRSSSSGEAAAAPQRRISRFLRPDFFDTPREESVYAREQDEQRRASRASKAAQEEEQAALRAKEAKEAKEQDPQDERKAAGSSRFLQSLERKLERLRSSQPLPPPPPAAPPAGSSRIESTIRSLRERSLEPKEADAAPTESSLLKRAVSVSDLAGSGGGGGGSGGGAGSRLAGRVMSLFRKDPADVKQGLIPSFRPHKAYTGSPSDSLLLERPRVTKVPDEIIPQAESLTNKAECTETKTGTEAAALPSSATDSHPVSADPNVPKVALAKSGSKIKGLSSSKSKSKVVKPKVEADPKPVETDAPCGISKSDLMTDNQSKVDTREDTTSSKILPDSSLPKAVVSSGEEGNLSTNPLPLKRDSLESVDNAQGLEERTLGGAESPSKTAKKPIQSEGKSEGPFVQSFSKIKIGSIDERAAAPKKSNSRNKMPVDDKASFVLKSSSKSRISADITSKTQHGNVVENGNDAPLFALSQQNGGPPVIKASSKVKVSKINSRSSDSPLKSATPSKMNRDDSKETSPVKSVSRTSLRREDSKAAPDKEIPPLKSSSRSAIHRKEVNSSSSKEISPVKSSSRTSLTRDDTKATTDKEISVTKSSSRSSLRREGSLIKSLSKSSVSKEDAKTTFPMRSSSRSKLLREESANGSSSSSIKPIPPSASKESFPHNPPIRSFSRSKLLKGDDKSVPLPKPTAVDEVKVTLPSRSSSRSKLSVDPDRKPSPTKPSLTDAAAAPGSSVRKSPPQNSVGSEEERRALPSKSSSKSRVSQGGSPVKSLSKSMLPKAEEKPFIKSGSKVQLEEDEQAVRSTARSLRKCDSKDNASSSVRRAQSSSPGLRQQAHSPSPGGPGTRHRPAGSRSASHSRAAATAAAAAAAAAGSPVVSFKDVERRHREMLLDKWSKSLQSLHLEAKKEKEAPAEVTPAVPSVPRPRPALHLDLFPIATPASGPSGTAGPSGGRPPSPCGSPSDSCSWSVCSEGDGPVSPSPSPTPHSPSAEDTESVSDRIRRKSFYSRFNDIKKKKKPSSSLTGSLSSPSRSRPVLDDALYSATTSRSKRSPRSPRSPVSPSARGSGLKYLHNGGILDSPCTPGLLSPASAAAIPCPPTWERSGIELRNDLMFHNLGLHRFDPNNLTINKDALFEMLSPPPRPKSPSPSPALDAALGVSDAPSTSHTSDQLEAVDANPNS